MSYRPTGPARSSVKLSFRRFFSRDPETCRIEPSVEKIIELKSIIQKVMIVEIVK